MTSIIRKVPQNENLHRETVTGITLHARLQLNMETKACSNTVDRKIHVTLSVFVGLSLNFVNYSTRRRLDMKSNFSLNMLH